MRYHWGMGVGHIYSWKDSDSTEAGRSSIFGFVGEPGDEEEVPTNTPISEEDEEGEFDLGDRENEYLSGDDSETFNSGEESDDETFMAIHDMYGV